MAYKITKPIGEVLSSPSKLGIVLSLKRGQKSFTEIQRELDMTSGNLNYFLIRLKSDGILDRTDEEKYALTSGGKTIADLVTDVLKESEKLRESGKLPG